MPITTAKVKTWICQTCPYRWQFSGDAIASTPYDLTDAQLKEQFPEPQFAGLTTGKCPNCFLQGVTSPLGLSVDISEMTEIIPATDDELGNQEVEELDANNQPIMVQTGSRWELSVDQATGKVGSVEVPVYEPKMRSLTTQELAELKQQRDQNLDALEKVAVKEVTE